jgi:mannose-6-phosphate isomerase
MAVESAAATDESVRPWGSYAVLDEGPTYKVKTITVTPGKRLSYQKHARRAEHWLVVAGEADVTLDGDVRRLRAGDAVDIGVGVAHRVQNPGTEPLVFVEVQQGDYFGEDDIVRLEDDYGRS